MGKIDVIPGKMIKKVFAGEYAKLSKLVDSLGADTGYVLKLIDHYPMLSLTMKIFFMKVKKKSLGKIVFVIMAILMIATSLLPALSLLR